MNIKQSLVVGVLASLTLTSCNKDFLNTEPTSTFSDSKLKMLSEKEKSDIINITLNGLYSRLYSKGVGGSESHTDFGQKGIDLFLDILLGDYTKVRNGYGWYEKLHNYTSTQDYLQNDNYIVWRYYYSIVFVANEVLETLGNDPSELSESLKKLRGQALGMRGYAYYYLAQLFSRQYDPEALVCPIYTSSEESALPMRKQKEVYDFIVKDLTEAKELLNDFTSPSKLQINSTVVTQFLALTYATMGDYAKVKELTQEVLNNKTEYTPFTKEDIVFDFQTGAGGNFNTTSTAGVVWGVNLSENENQGLVSFYGITDIFTYGYTMAGDVMQVSDVLYNHIPDNDIRKKQFVDWSTLGSKKIDPKTGKPKVDLDGDPIIYYKEGTTERTNSLYGNPRFKYVPSNKFFHRERIYGKQRLIDADYIFMRIGEVYFLNAEAKAFLGDDAGAIAVLKSYLKDRFTSETDVNYLDALSGQALKDEIYMQYRIEFFGEGKAFLALKRFKKNVEIGHNRFDSPDFYADERTDIVTIPYNDKRLSFKIPQRERIDNPNLNLPAGYDN